MHIHWRLLRVADRDLGTPFTVEFSCSKKNYTARLRGLKAALVGFPRPGAHQLKQLEAHVRALLQEGDHIASLQHNQPARPDETKAAFRPAAWERPLSEIQSAGALAIPQPDTPSYD